MPDTQEYERRVELWIEALESGEYIQGSGQLRSMYDDLNRYCCLGVACDLYAKLTGRGRWFNSQFVTSTGDLGVSSLPPEVADYFGLSSRDGSFIWGRDLPPDKKFMEEGFDLISLNDKQESLDCSVTFSFHDIAVVLRARPRGLFTWT